jgi:hypothetical protein
MAGKLSPIGARRLGELEELTRRVQRVYAMVEQFAAVKQGADALSQSMKRELQRLKMQLGGAGLDSIAQLAGGMEIAAGRSGSQSVKTRILREGIASIKFQMELEQRTILAEEGRMQHEKMVEKEAIAVAKTAAGVLAKAEAESVAKSEAAAAKIKAAEV